MDGGVTVGDARLASLADLIEAEDFETAVGKVEPLIIATDYSNGVCEQNVLAKPLTVVIDCGNGAPGAFAPQLYRQLGCHVIELFCEVDGHFPNHHPIRKWPPIWSICKRRWQRITLMSGWPLTATGIAWAW